MEETYAASIVGKVLAEEDVKYVFSVHGAGTYPTLMGMADHGIHMYHMRHEQSAGYAADGSARASRKVAVCTVMGGVGMENILPAVAHCNLVHSPMIVFVGQHSATQDGMKTWIEGYGADCARPIAKWAHRIVEPHAIAHNVRKAVQIATSAPTGSVLLEVPWNVSIARVDYQLWDVDPARRPRVVPAQGSAKAVEQLVEMLMAAKKPLIIGGDGIFWSDAAKELREVAQTLRVPVHCRRMGRGAVPESDPLSASGEQRGKLLKEADLIVMVGLEASFFDDWFQPPNWSHDPKVKYVQVHENPDNIFLGLPTELAIAGSSKLVLQQCLDIVRQNNLKAPERAEWLGLLVEIKARQQKRLKERMEKERAATPLHPDLVAAELIDMLDADASVILDSFTLSSFSSERLSASFPGQVLDAGLQIAVGHSVGIAVGAQIARPGKQVVALIGDGGIGISGFDIETCVRYNLPAIFMCVNNSSWGGRTTDQNVLWPGIAPWDITPGIRYDRIFAEMGCHGENIERADDIKPALERALSSGKPTVVNVVCDTTEVGALPTRTSFIECFGRRDIAKCPPETKQLYRSIAPAELERIAAWMKDWGISTNVKELQDYIASAD